MNDNIRHLLDQISTLDAELRQALQAQEADTLLHLKDKKVEFETSVRQAHLKLKKGLFHWLVTYRPQNLLTGPVIYSMAIPLGLLDLSVSLYQATCFPIYGIAKVRRRDYLVFDRQQLGYLNIIEKFHCTYCAYANGLLAYTTEIVGRTEAYFCPIKHARKVLGAHAHYARFLGYGQAQDYETELEKFRVALGETGTSKDDDPA